MYLLNMHQKGKKIERERKEGGERKRREERWRRKGMKEKENQDGKFLVTLNVNSII